MARKRRKRKTKSVSFSTFAALLFLFWLLTQCGRYSRENHAGEPIDLLSHSLTSTQIRLNYTATKAMHYTVVESTLEQKRIEQTVDYILDQTERPTREYLSTAHAEETRVIRQATVEYILEGMN